MSIRAAGVIDFLVCWPDMKKLRKELPCVSLCFFSPPIK